MAHIIGVLLDANYNQAHNDHIHVEPPTQMSGTPPHTNPGMTDGIKIIYDALEEQFGPGEYFLDENGRYVGNDPGVYWTHMGGYNRRYIAGTTRWSQHAWWNALDIGPYVGIEDQQKFIDFLVDHVTEGGYNDMPQFSDKTAEILQQVANAIAAKDSHGDALTYVIDAIRDGGLASKNYVRNHVQVALEDIDTEGLKKGDKFTVEVV